MHHDQCMCMATTVQKLLISEERNAVKSPYTFRQFLWEPPEAAARGCWAPYSTPLLPVWQANRWQKRQCMMLSMRSVYVQMTKVCAARQDPTPWIVSVPGSACSQWVLQNSITCLQSASCSLLPVLSTSCSLLAAVYYLCSLQSTSCSLQSTSCSLLVAVYYLCSLQSTSCSLLVAVYWFQSTSCCLLIAGYYLQSTSLVF